MAQSKPLLPEDSLSLPGCESADADRTEAAALQLAADLTAEMLKPIRDISKSAGEMERNSPLFFGAGDNPSLF